ncbi:MAG: hypothetical protein ACJAR4_002655, partial [Psychroserpens sp.]
MKNLIIALITLSIFACKPESKVDYAIISGKIENSKAKTATLKNADFKAEIAINEDGTFADTLRIPENGFYTMSIGREFTPIHIGFEDSLYVTLDAMKFDQTITYTGQGALKNNYLASKTLHNGKITSNAAEFYSLEENAFKTKISKIKIANETLLNGLTNADEAFISAEKQNLIYDKYLMTNNYSQRHGYY